MVAHDPNRPFDPSRGISTAALARLRDAIEAQWRTSQQDSAETRAALRAVAQEARDRHVYPETLVLLIKELEADVSRAVRERASVTQQQMREWLVSTCLRAFYDREGK